MRKLSFHSRDVRVDCQLIKLIIWSSVKTRSKKNIRFRHSLTGTHGIFPAAPVFFLEGRGYFPRQVRDRLWGLDGSRQFLSRSTKRRQVASHRAPIILENVLFHLMFQWLTFKMNFAAVNNLRTSRLHHRHSI